MAAPILPNLDTVTSINRDGSHARIHPADVAGRYTWRRRLSAYALIAFFIALPWIDINGYPAVFLDIAHQRFHLFGVTLAFQDTWLLFFVVSGLAFLLFFVTAFVGRVWCGWVCPQTVYLEHVFRRLERLIDGDAASRRRLDAAPWSPEKVFKRLLKHSLFLLASAVIAHIFLSYFVSLPKLWALMTHSPVGHWDAFLFVGAFTAILYGNFSWFREHLCIVICPYGRFQSALIDEDTRNVAYDFTRGNPPGRPNTPGAGDCIDCRRCVQVCPTGIDIRQGLQLECVACTSCIDACDAIMDKLHRPRGLIRYASDRELRGLKTRLIRPRTIIYTFLLFLGAAVALTAFSEVAPADAFVSRMAGSSFYVTDTAIRNQYRIRLVNKSDVVRTFHISAQADAQKLLSNDADATYTVPPMQETVVTFVAQTARASFTDSFRLHLEIRSDPGNIVLSRAAEFLGPDPRLLK